jgi:hypothetical protein
MEKCAERTIEMWLVANSGGVLDVRVAMAAAGLELLGWAVLQHQKWLTTDALGKLTAGARTRLLLQWASIPIEVPSGFTALPARLRRFGRPDEAGPEVVTEVRNLVMHPPKKLNDPEWPGSDELYEAWRLGMATSTSRSSSCSPTTASIQPVFG